MEHANRFHETDNVPVSTFTYKFPVENKKIDICTIQELLTEDSYPFTFNKPVDSSNRQFKFVHYDPTPHSIEDTIDIEKLLSNSYRTRNLFIWARSVMSSLVKQMKGDTKISTISKMVSKVRYIDIEFFLFLQTNN